MERAVSKGIPPKERKENEMRTYTAMLNDMVTEFEFKSDHRAGSKKNYEDAHKAALKKFGELVVYQWPTTKAIINIRLAD